MLPQSWVALHGDPRSRRWRYTAAPEYARFGTSRRFHVTYPRRCSIAVGGASRSHSGYLSGGWHRVILWTRSPTASWSTTIAPAARGCPTSPLDPEPYTITVVLLSGSVGDLVALISRFCSFQACRHPTGCLASVPIRPSPAVGEPPNWTTTWIRAARALHGWSAEVQGVEGWEAGRKRTSVRDGRKRAKRAADNAVEVLGPAIRNPWDLLTYRVQVYASTSPRPTRNTSTAASISCWWPMSPA